MTPEQEIAEQCAKLCEEIIEHPAGYGGRWEGYGLVNIPRSGEECAKAIREKFVIN